MLNFKKPHTWVAVFVVAVIVIVAANFLTNQKTVERKDSISDTTNTQIENAEVELTKKQNKAFLIGHRPLPSVTVTKLLRWQPKMHRKLSKMKTCCRQANRMEKLFIPLDGPAPGRVLSIIPASHPTCCIPQMSKIRLLTFFIMQKFPTRM